MTTHAPADLRLDRRNAALLIVDVQERLTAVMAPGEVAVLEENLSLLLELARRTGLPTVLSEQYPRGLGPTIAGVRNYLPEDVVRIEKVTFSCTDDPGFMEVHRRLARKQWIVAGLETHICVYQTARGLRALGDMVHVPSDAVLSRSPANLHAGLRLIEQAGAVITATESVIFDVLERAGTDEFRAMSKLVK
jgi:nicotinamidase-related amidase